MTLMRFAARKASPMLYFSAARAYIELGLYQKAAECLNNHALTNRLLPLIR